MAMTRLDTIKQLAQAEVAVGLDGDQHLDRGKNRKKNEKIKFQI